LQPLWLNLTGYPPIPTGALTVAQPTLVASVDGCTNPSTMWSCALPKEEQQAVEPNQSDQPNFTLSIRFRNDTISNTTLTQPTSRFAIRRFHGERAVPNNPLFSPFPSPPSAEDQAFLGKTTDNTTQPFQGEKTPFFISFEANAQTPSRTVKRAVTTTTASDDDLTTVIPSPDVNSDGTAASANLLPSPSEQPLQLYDRGLETEHYGFFIYYDRSIFMKSIQFQNSSDAGLGEIPADQNGGSTFVGATARCTWAQTRYLVQIWTRAGDNAKLLPASNDTSRDAVYNRPGTFPYPLTITLDRHGGDQSSKMVYCYGMDERGRIVAENKMFQAETRSFQGKLVNPSKGPFENVTVSPADGGPGGIDGGTGGCLCKWQN
ncbi:hypothetical protein K402DRAFT_316191, partial [Aulographum hederae CBS 113979]